ncbi:SMP-30/gluconolactonase/LRE family protein [Sphingomonas alpina]|nr:SMP-30/gluconolactonase/LRE family protein [Sphingomonas alpina]
MKLYNMRVAAAALFLILSGVAHAQQGNTTLAYDAANRGPVPIPPSEIGLQTVTAEPWLSLAGQRLFLEGAVFDKANDLLFVDMFSGRVLKVDPSKSVSTVVERNTIVPTGLAVHRDGRLFLAGVGNMRSGSVVAFRADGRGRAEIIPPGAGYVPDDLVFDSVGGFYFADFKGTSTQSTGGVYYASPDGRISPILPNLSAANGVALSPDGKTLWVTEYARNVLHRVTLADATTVAPVGTAIAYHFTGPSPDGLRVDADGNVYAAMFHQGRILVFNRNGLPIGQILIPGRDEGRFLLTTSLAFKPGTNEIYIVATDGEGSAGATIFRASGFAKAAIPFSHR